MKEVTIWDNRPREMWVWDYDFERKERVRVVYLCDVDKVAYPVVTLSGSTSENLMVKVFKHCAEIEEPKKRRMTNKEFTLWLLEGIRNGKLRQWRRINSDTIESVPCGYTSEYEDLFVENKLIREYGGEWHEPLVEE